MRAVSGWQVLGRAEHCELHTGSYPHVPRRPRPGPPRRCRPCQRPKSPLAASFPFLCTPLGVPTAHASACRRVPCSLRAPRSASGSAPTALRVAERMVSCARSASPASLRRPSNCVQPMACPTAQPAPKSRRRARRGIGVPTRPPARQCTSGSCRAAVAAGCRTTLGLCGAASPSRRHSTNRCASPQTSRSRSWYDAASTSTSRALTRIRAPT